MSPRRNILALLLTLTAASCAPSNPPPQKIDPAAWNAPNATAVTHSGAVEVAEGGLPLVYQAISAGAVNVTDSSAGKSLASVAVRPGDVVAVSSKGVEVAGIRVFSGALPADHRFAISFEIDHPEAAPPSGDSGKK